MTAKDFYLSGEASATAVTLDISPANDTVTLQRMIANHFGIVVPESVGFESAGAELPELGDVESTVGKIGVTVDGHAVREVPGPAGLPFLGNYLEGECCSQ